jgi:signal transduction histidine kinase
MTTAVTARSADGGAATTDGGDGPAPPGVLADPARLAAVRATGLLDRASEPAFDRLTRLAVRLVGVPAAFITLVDESRDFYVSNCGFPEALATARELAGPTFCHHAIAAPGPLVIPDTAADPAYRDLPTVRSLGVAAYVGVPLVIGGQSIGSFCVIDHAPRAWTVGEVDVLTELGASAQREVELRAAERAAAETATRLRVAMEAARLGAWSFDPVRGACWHAASTNALHGRAAVEEEISAAEWAACIHPDDRARAQGAFAEAVANGAPFAVEYRVVWPDGTVRWVAAAGRALDDPPERIVGTAQDVTDRRLAEFERERLLGAERAARAAAQAAEMRLRDVFDQAPVAVAVLEGPDHVYTVVSPRYSESPGGGRPLIGRSVREAFPEVAGTGYFEIMDRVYETGEPYAAAERQVAVARGGAEPEERYFNIGYQPLRDAEGRVYSIASVTYDVTEQVRARRELEAARAEADTARRAAEAANAVKAQFLATMSHELRTPLNAIGGYAQLIEMGVRGPVTAAQQEDLARIQQSQQHLLGLINSVLNYAKLEAGRVAYDLAEVRLAAAVAAVEALVSPQMRAKGLDFAVPACEPGLAALADAEKLRQIVLNLLSNATKFTPAGGRIAVECGEDGAGRVFVRVTDTGVGIAPEQLESVFDPFVQVGRRLTTPGEGVGLGLAISRDLARGMGGDLSAESAPGAGSAFTLTLPAAS